MADHTQDHTDGDSLNEFSEEKLLRLWGKTKDRDPNATTYHPLLFHLIDVANAARVLWRLLPIYMKERMQLALGVATIEEAERVVVLLAGLHDLGKASSFQTKASRLWAHVERVLPLKAPTRRGWEQERIEPHAWVTAFRPLLPDLLMESSGPTSLIADSVKLVTTLASITGAHHGKFPKTGFSVAKEHVGGDNWTKARRALSRSLVAAVYGDRTGAMPPTIHLSASRLDDLGIGAYLTGLIAVADWIGSSSAFFPLDSQARALKEYKILSRRRAQQAVWRFGWYPPKKLAGPLPFKEIVWDRADDGTPVQFENSMQALTEQFARAAGNRSYLLIIEAAMGDGKTEAAVYAADYGMTACGRSGFYIALPTQATGNAMLRRVNAYLANRGHQGKLNIQLVHGGKDFNPDFEALRQNAEQLKVNANGTAGEGDDAMRLVAESWFTHSKQGLLAPFGVGTIDQSLMGVLQTKHWFVRLFGLAGKTVIFDEIHSYDLYVSSLLETLIGWLAELGCTVILLSATLPRARREALMRAYRHDVAIETASYPRITFVPKEGSDSNCVHIPDDSDKKPEDKYRTVKLEWVLPNPTAIPTRIAQDLPRGGCAAVIANTVAQATAYYDAIVQSDLVQKGGWRVTLLHARMPLLWRQERETEVLARFGKTSTPADRDKQILVSTQIIEQSLNIDFDWMASEFAPVDLMLQRIGRLWRHIERTKAGQRPVEIARFVALIGQESCEDSDTDSLPIFAPNSDVVYDKYILLRSYLAVRDKTQIDLPNDIETLVNTVYDGEPTVPNGRWQAEFDMAWAKREAANQTYESVAKTNKIPEPHSGSDFRSTILEARLDLREEDDPTMHETMRATTRLGDPSILLICLRQDSDGKLCPFCHPNSELTVSLDEEPSDELVRAMRESAVSVARPKDLFFALIGRPVPKEWKGNAHLRYARYAVFTDGKSQILTKSGDLTLQLTKETGLRVIDEQGIKEPDDTEI